MAVTSERPVVLAPYFQEEDELRGLSQFGKAMLEERFTLVLERDVDSNPGLLNAVQGIIVCPGTPTKLIKREMMRRMPNLAVVSTVSSGYNYLDVAYLRERKIRVGITPGVLSDATAEMAIALIMAAARDLRSGMALAMGPDPVTKFGINRFQQEVTGSTLGIVGMGGIGFEVAKRARGLKMNILYHNRNRRLDDVEVGAEYVATLDALLPRCDFVLLSCPLGPDTTHLISHSQLKLMKSTAFLVNIARGAVVDTMALVKALQENLIAGAALDVTDPEPLPRDHPLLSCSNVIITPHWGSATLKTRTAMYQRAVDNLHAVLLGDGNMPSELK